jgi:hypothetical protein
MGKVTKVDHSSKAKGFNVRDFIPPRDTIHTHEDFQILSQKKNNLVNGLGTVHEPPNPRWAGGGAWDRSRRS